MAGKSAAGKSCFFVNGELCNNGGSGQKWRQNKSLREKHRDGSRRVLANPCCCSYSYYCFTFITRLLFVSSSFDLSSFVVVEIVFLVEIVMWQWSQCCTSQVSVRLVSEATQRPREREDCHETAARRLHRSIRPHSQHRTRSDALESRTVHHVWHTRHCTPSSVVLFNIKFNTNRLVSKSVRVSMSTSSSSYYFYSSSSSSSTTTTTTNLFSALKQNQTNKEKFAAAFPYLPLLRAQDLLSELAHGPSSGSSSSSSSSIGQLRSIHRQTRLYDAHTHTSIQRDRERGARVLRYILTEIAAHWGKIISTSGEEPSIRLNKSRH